MRILAGSMDFVVQFLPAVIYTLYLATTCSSEKGCESGTLKLVELWACLSGGNLAYFGSRVLSKTIVLQQEGRKKEEEQCIIH